MAFELAPGVLALSGARLSFAEQIAAFRAKLNLPTQSYKDLQGAAHDRAFVVAGAMAADLLQDLRTAVDAAVAGGESLGAFQARFADIVAQHGWAHSGSRDWRSRIIYGTNLATSYAAGRWHQLQAAAADGLVWMYRHSDSVLSPRPLHVAWSGLALPASHPWWRTHYPPNGWGCKCTVVAVHPDEVAARGGRAGPPPDDGTVTDPFGAERPRGIDRGWDYAPGEGAGRSWSSLIADKLLRWDARLGADAWSAMSQTLVPHLAAEFRAWANAVDQPRGAVRIVGAMSPAVVRALAAEGVAPQSAHIAVRDVDVIHTHRDPKTAGPLDWAWYLDLPAHLAHPSAVLLDRTQARPALLYVYEGSGAAAKLVLLLDYRIGINEGGRRRNEVTNVLRSGRTLQAQALRDPKSYQLLDGEL